MRRFLLLASTAAILTGAAASAADLGDTKKPGLAPVESFNPWMIRFRALGVIPDDRSSVSVGGVGIPGNGNLAVTNSAIPEVDVTYFFTPNVAVEVIAGVTPHSIKATGNLAGVGKVGSTVLLPPTVTAQYHFWLGDTIKPYVGAGVNYTFFLNEKEKGAFTAFNVKNSWGLALQAGVDVMLTKNWGINLDVKKLFLEPKYTATIGAVPVAGKARLNPWLIGGGVTYRF